MHQLQTEKILKSTNEKDVRKILDMKHVKKWKKRKEKKIHGVRDWFTQWQKYNTQYALERSAESISLGGLKPAKLKKHLLIS